MTKIGKIKKQFADLEAAHTRMLIMSDNLEKSILPCLDFSDFSDDWQQNGISIFYQMEDGFVLEFESNNAPLSACIKKIEKNGKLTFEDYRGITI